MFFSESEEHELKIYTYILWCKRHRTAVERIDRIIRAVDIEIIGAYRPKIDFQRPEHVRFCI